MTFVDLLLYSEEHVKDARMLYKLHEANLGYLHYLPVHYRTQVIQLAGINKEITIDGVKFVVQKHKNSKWSLHLALFRQIKKMNPDVILVHSMIFAWQIIVLRWVIGSRIKLIVQNHAEQPFGFKRRWIQRIAAKYVSAFLFVSKDQSKAWYKARVLNSKSKVFELMEGSTSFQAKNKELAKLKHHYESKILFLWVGRLDANKDPLTILNAFSRFVKTEPEAHLIMIYGSTELENEVKNAIGKHSVSQHVSLLGAIEHAQLEEYYNAADYFILGSHHEGSGYALCEAMACGCVPIITKIPSFNKMTEFGDCAFLFEPGNEEELVSILKNLNKEDLPKLKQKVLDKFASDLSFAAIAKRLNEIIMLIQQE